MPCMLPLDSNGSWPNVEWGLVMQGWQRHEFIEYC